MRVLFVGGGTLGSVTPLLAVAEALPKMVPSKMVPGTLTEKVPGTIFGTIFAIFWGTRRGPERALVEAAGIPFRSIPAGKLRRYWDIRNLLDVFVITWACIAAFVWLIRERPSVVVGAGSFVQVPVMWAAWLLRIPIVIHQLDLRPSLANRLVAPLARAITVTFPASAHAFRRAQVIGASVRRAVLAAGEMDPHAAKHRFGFTGDRPVLLVIGGGTGAQALNALVRTSLLSLTSHADVIHVTGKGKMPRHCEGASATEAIPSTLERDRHGPMAIGPRDDTMEEHYRSFELLTDDLPSAYAAAELVVARAGMGTITELVALRKPMVLVPMPGTHQEENAAALAASGAAVIWRERGCTADAFADRIRELLADPQRRATLARACGTCIASGAADRLAAVVRAAARPLPM